MHARAVVVDARCSERTGTVPFGDEIRGAVCRRAKDAEQIDDDMRGILRENRKSSCGLFDGGNARIRLGVATEIVQPTCGWTTAFGIDRKKAECGGIVA